MAQNENMKQSFTISEETAELLAQLKTANKLFNETYECIRKKMPQKAGDEDGTKAADGVFAKYFGEAQKVTREAYLRAISDNVENALLDGESMVI